MKRGVCLYDWLLGNHLSGVQPPGGPCSFVVLLSVSSYFPLGIFAGSTAKIKTL